jgi:hypothetical protein
MTSVRFGVQTVIVLLLVAFVSWPDYARLKGATVSRTSGERPRQDDARRGADRRARGLRYEIGYGSISLQRASATTSDALQRKLYEGDLEARRHRVPVGLLALGARFNGIIGQARTALNAPVPFARLVLRNPVTGRIEARAVANDKGEFTFLDISPNGYVIELLGPNDSVFAASDLVSIDIGELREATVRMPGGREVLAALGTLTPTANEPIAAAATSGVNAVTAPDRSVSPQR